MQKLGTLSCDRLTPDEIERIQSDKGFIYICKSCKTSDNTEPKMIAIATTDCDVSDRLEIEPTNCSSGPITDKHNSEQVEKLKLPIPYSLDTSAKTCAAAILNEESTDLCCVCNGEINNDGNRCSLCTLVCHDACMCVEATEDDTCLTCTTNQSQRRTSQENEGSEVQLSPHENGRYGETLQKAPNRGNMYP